MVKGSPSLSFAKGRLTLEPPPNPRPQSKALEGPKEFEMAERVSNKQLLEAIENIGPSIVAALAAAAPQVTPTVPSSAKTKGQVTEGGVKVDDKYRKVMSEKAQNHADKYREEVVLYAKHNRFHEVKLAFATRSKFSPEVNGYLGSIGVFSPSS